MAHQGNTWGQDRLSFIGGSDARVIMGNDEAALVRLWREKRGEIEPEDLSGNLIVQLGLVTEAAQSALVRAQHRANRQCVQHRLRHPVLRWMGATLDGMVDGQRGGIRGQVHAALVILGRGGGRKTYGPAPAQYVGHQCQGCGALDHYRRRQMGRDQDIRRSPLPAPALTAEKKFWRCVESGEPPRLFGIEPPRARIEAVRIVDMSSSNAWAEFAAVFRRTRAAYLEHENAKAELKALMPEDAKEAIGHGIRAKRSKSGAVSFDVLNMEASHAPVQ